MSYEGTLGTIGALFGVPPLGGIGVAEEHAYSVKKIESDYFEAG